MDGDLLKQVLVDQNSQAIPKNLIERDIFKTIEQSDNLPLIKIITGVRRSGKSTILKALKEKHYGYFVSFDDDRLVSFSIEDFQVMHELLIEIYGVQNTFYFDEIQNIPGWERYVRRLHDSKKNIYVTGSNASMLSRELGTHLTGRNIPFALFPFSFKEFLRFKGFKIDVNQTTDEKGLTKGLFNEYISKGGFAEYLITEKDEYLKSVFENILYRDIIVRYNLPNEKILKEVIFFTASNIGREISFNSIKKFTGLTSATTVKQYFDYFENSYLAFLVPTYNKSLKKQIYSNKKAYLIDTAFARMLGFRKDEDIGRMLENIVFLELKRQNKEIFFHKEKSECDFLIRDGIRIKEAIQVTKDLQNEKTRKRELNGLNEAMTSYKLDSGLILTTDYESNEKIDGKQIKIMPIWKWLLGI